MKYKIRSIWRDRKDSHTLTETWEVGSKKKLEAKLIECLDPCRDPASGKPVMPDEAGIRAAFLRLGETEKTARCEIRRCKAAFKAYAEIMERLSVRDDASVEAWKDHTVQVALTA